MTKNQAEQILPVMDAFSKGMAVQSATLSHSDWIDEDNPDFSVAREWRVKPVPKLIPFETTDLNLFIDKLICEKDRLNLLFKITGIDTIDSQVLIGDEWVGLERLFYDYIFADGTACGKMSEEC